jgi:hypothetical protein
MGFENVLYLDRRHHVHNPILPVGLDMHVQHVRDNVEVNIVAKLGEP